MTDFSLKNSKSAIVSQSPSPKVAIIDQDTELSVITLGFESDDSNLLQGYAFSFGTDDSSGSFDVTIYPQESKGLQFGGKFNTNGYVKEYLFDVIKTFMIVKIWENKNDTCPSFIGVIHSKKFVAQAGANTNRRISISGTSVAGLVSTLKINLSFRASAISKQLVSQEALDKKLTVTLNDKTNLSEIFGAIWEAVSDLAGKYHNLTTPKIIEYINKWSQNAYGSRGSLPSMFSIEESKLKYPIACIFNGSDSDSFWDIIGKVLPSPIYEKFAISNGSGIIIRIREAPFDCAGNAYDGNTDAWNSLERIRIKSERVKDFQIEQNDNEVYTAFFAYLSGAAVSQDFALTLASQTDALGSADFVTSAEKFSKYGYRPLEVSFNGYGIAENKQTSGEQNASDLDMMKNMSLRMRHWFENLDTMLSGSITLATDFSEKKENRIFVGKKVSFLHGDFYVTKETHSWNYGGNPETKLTVTRGGDYSSGKYAELKNVTERYIELKKLIDDNK